MKLIVSKGRLIREDGTPFLYLGDTAWHLFHHLTKEETEHYLQTRKSQGFNVVQAVAIAESWPPDHPNRYDQAPLPTHDPNQPNEGYFEFVDWVVQRANEMGFVVALLPAWGDKWNKRHGVGPEIFTVENAFNYGMWLGARYKDADLIWVTGGDRPIENGGQLEIIRAMARGLREGDCGNHLITFHPSGGTSSSQFVHEEEWLDFHMFQSGHRWKGFDNAAFLRHDLALHPPRPVLDGEPCYENHPVMGQEWQAPYHGWFDERDTRQAAYQALFSGACGHAYGCHDIWQFVGATDLPVKSAARTHWREALLLPGATQMLYVKKLLESRDWSRLEPAAHLVINADIRVTVARHQDGSTLLAYFPHGAPATLDLTPITGQTFRVSWFNPRTGRVETHFSLPRPRWGNKPENPCWVFTPPAEGTDWVLVVDDASRPWPEPGPTSAPA